MLKIEPNKLIIELNDLYGLEADTAEKIYTELIDLLQCALILQDEYGRPVTSSYYGVLSLLKALTPSWEQLERRLQ